MRYTLLLAGTLVAGTALALTVGAVLADGRHDGDRARGAAGHAAQVTAMFDRMDANGDDRVTADEIAAARAGRLAAADSNGDGVLGIEEFTAQAIARATARAPEMFGRLDADGDGALSAAEMEPRRGGMLAWLDADKDGAITRDEAMAAKRHHGGRFTE